MDRVANLPVGQNLLQWFGDYQWASRRPGVFNDPRLANHVPSVSEAVAQLEHLYGAEECRKLVEQGHWLMVMGLFGADIGRVEEKLLLGGDLACCQGWRDRPGLLGGLRSPDYDGVRFEVGVWAGLTRLGYAPQLEPEPTDVRTPKRVDFMVADGGVNLAIELKALSNPSRDRNSKELTFQLAQLVYPAMGPSWQADVDLRLSSEARDWLGKGHVDFFRDHWPTIREELTSAIPMIRHDIDIPLPSAGTLVVRSRATDDGFAGSYTLDGIDPRSRSPRSLAVRAVRRVREATMQLAAAAAGLRVAVVHGSAELLPCNEIAAELPSLLADQPDTRIADVVDWIAIVNCEATEPLQPWLKRTALQRLPSARGDLPSRIIDALTEWGR